MPESTKERITSATEYNKYLKVIKPSVWIIICAILLLIGVAIFWAFTGNILTTQTCKSVILSDTAIGYLELSQAGAVQSGQKVNVTVEDRIVGGVVERVADLPSSRDEAVLVLGSQALADHIVPQSGGVEVVARLSHPIESSSSTIAGMEIITQDVTPIQLFMGKG